MAGTTLLSAAIARSDSYRGLGRHAPPHAHGYAPRPWSGTLDANRFHAWIRVPCDCDTRTDAPPLSRLARSSRTSRQFGNKTRDDLKGTARHVADRIAPAGSRACSRGRSPRIGRADFHRRAVGCPSRAARPSRTGRGSIRPRQTADGWDDFALGRHCAQRSYRGLGRHAPPQRPRLRATSLVRDVDLVSRLDHPAVDCSRSSEQNAGRPQPRGTSDGLLPQGAGHVAVDEVHGKACADFHRRAVGCPSSAAGRAERDADRFGLGKPPMAGTTLLSATIARSDLTVGSGGMRRPSAHGYAPRPWSGTLGFTGSRCPDCGRHGRGCVYP